MPTRLSFFTAVGFALWGLSAAANETATAWAPAAVRDEVRPDFRFEPQGGRKASAAWVIAADGRQGLDGYWRRSFPVSSAGHYRCQAFCRTEGVSDPQMMAFVHLSWRDAEGKLVRENGETVLGVYPAEARVTADGWTVFEETFRAPAGTVAAEVELRFRWPDPNSEVRWSDVSLTPVPAPQPRLVRLAAVHHRPTGATVQDRRASYAPLLEKAAAQKADLVVLGECLTSFQSGGPKAEVAESIPGPSTEYFGELAHRHDMYIVVPITERDGHLFYNAAALIGPDGTVMGKYRKVCLPRSEWQGGTTAGRDYPVFDTRFGKVGMMICWDLQYPEVAARLADKGAEVIALPIWGGNPKLVAARAIENQVYLVTSTYSQKPEWMVTGVWDHTGELISQADEWGNVVVTEIDLNTHHIWWSQPGDYKSSRVRERPPRAN